MKIEENILLKDFTSYKTGGPARYFALCKNNLDIQNALNFANSNNIDYEIIGGGANLLVSDKGYNGLIIATPKLNRYIINYGNNIIKCGAGVLLSDLVAYTCSHGLSGMEDMAGIPGCIGGAIKMNAGAYSQEIKDTNLEVTLMDNQGNIIVKSNKDINYSYRKSEGTADYIILSAKFLYKKDDSEVLMEKRKEILNRRRQNHPLHKPSCGSVFKRPAGNYAGTLIEKCGLKGYSIGGAMVSEKHANFILNENNATSNDIYSLIKYIKEVVYKKTEILLEEEVKLIGF